MLDLRDVSVRFPRSRRPALRELSLCIGTGESWGIIGESGAGKSTLLGLMSGEITPSTGSVLWRGKPLKRGAPLRQLRNDLGVIAQRPREALDPRQTAFEAVWEASALFGTPWTKAQTEHLLDTVGLRRERWHSRPDELSGGECQRTNLARAVAKSPALLLADEPLVSLDHEAARLLQPIIVNLALNASTALVYVTHDLTDDVLRDAGIAVFLDGWCVEVVPPPDPRWLREVGDLATTGVLSRRLLHPYSHYLVLASVSPVPPRQRAATGCPFHPSCPHVREDCRLRVPDENELVPGRKIRCFAVTGEPTSPIDY
jgi:ABC-type dipeptide/oligopeptide/nickel transport system ATPase subunit